MSGRTWATLAAIAALLVGAAIASLGGDERGARGAEMRARVDATPSDGRSPREPAGSEQRVLVGLPRPALGERKGVARMPAREQRRYVRSLQREARSLRSALEASKIVFRDVVEYERVWNGFATTVRTRDLTRLGSLGVRPEPVRRFYPALGEPVAPAPAEYPGGTPGDSPPAYPGGTPGDSPPVYPGGTQVAVALLAGGVEVGHPRLRGRLIAGFDAVAGDDDPAPGRDPRDARRSETSGTALAGVLAAAGARVRPVRVSALRASPEGVAEYATTDTLLAGLERVADPDRNGDARDHDSVALVGVNAPYLGFAGTPEADAIAAARALGVRVVAPAGNEGPGTVQAGTVGSPAAARTALAVTAQAAPDALPRLDVAADGRQIRGAALLAGTRTPRGALPLTQIAPDVDTLRTRPVALAGRVAVIRAASPDAIAAAGLAATGGAEAVVLAAPGSGTLGAIPAGAVSVPVLAVTGEPAAVLLRLPDGERLGFGPLRRGRLPTGVRRPLAPTASRGPTLDGARKPAFSAPGAAVTAGPGGSTALVGGTAVAAAHAAVRLATNLRPDTDARAGLRTGGTIKGLRVSRPRGQAPPVPLGELTLTRDEGRVTGVRFRLGAFARGPRGTTVRAASRLDLVLADAESAVVRRLTPPGGARALIPGVYAYTLPAAALGDLTAGRYAFRATARTPRRRAPVTRGSRAFTIG